MPRWCMCVARVAASHESIVLKDSDASIFIISCYIHPDLLRLYVLQYYSVEIKTRISVGGHVSCLSSHHLTPLTVKLLPCASGNLPRRTVMPRGDSFLQVFDLNKIKEQKPKQPSNTRQLKAYFQSRNKPWGIVQVVWHRIWRDLGIQSDTSTFWENSPQYHIS